METITNKLTSIQAKLSAPKNQYNSFGKYKYRNAEDIIESVKPLTYAEGCALIIDEEVFEIGGKLCMKSTAKLTDGKEFISCTGLAFIDLSKKGMSSEQATGAASSYAKKYALGNLFAIDDTKDADSIIQYHGNLNGEELKISHKAWDKALKALQTGETTVDKIGLKYKFTENSRNMLKTHEKLG
jgi:hypothetical protein